MERHPWQVWLMGAIGLWLIVSPFVMGSPFAEAAGAGAFRWTFVSAGAAVAVLVLGALSNFRAWEAGLVAAVGAWLLVSPWMLGFTAAPPALWSAVAPGGALIGLGVWAGVSGRGGHAR